MERIAAESGIEIEFVRSRKSLRKEDRVKAGLEKRGEHPGVVCIFSPMEPRGSYQPWHDKTNHKMYLKPDDGKRLHCYLYFIDEDLGLCSSRVPAWVSRPPLILDHSRFRRKAKRVSALQAGGQ